MKDTIKLLRERENYSQAGIANAIGVSRQMYIKYESGLVEPPVSVIKELCKIYNISYETIIDDILNNQEKSTENLYGSSDSEDIVVAEPAATYNSNLSLETTIENLKKLSSDKLLCAASYISYLRKNDSKIMHKKNNSLLKCAGKIHIDFDLDELARFRER